MTKGQTIKVIGEAAGWLNQYASELFGGLRIGEYNEASRVVRELIELLEELRQDGKAKESDRTDTRISGRP